MDNLLTGKIRSNYISFHVIMHRYEGRNIKKTQTTFLSSSF